MTCTTRKVSTTSTLKRWGVKKRREMANDHEEVGIVTVVVIVMMMVTSRRKTGRPARMSMRK